MERLQLAFSKSYLSASPTTRPLNGKNIIRELQPEAYEFHNEFEYSGIDRQRDYESSGFALQPDKFKFSSELLNPWSALTSETGTSLNNTAQGIAPVNPLSELAGFVSTATQPTTQNALSITKSICQFHRIPWRVAFTILQHEGGIGKFHHPDGVMQTIQPARNNMIPVIPRALKLALLELPSGNQLSDRELSAALHQQFPLRLAVQIATGVQELKDGLDKFNGYVALAYQAYNAGSGWVYFTVSGGKTKQRPKGISNEYWETMCRFGASLLHQSVGALRIELGTWQCDKNIPTWSSHMPVFDRYSGLQLIAFKYLRSITERIRSVKPVTPCTLAVHGARNRQPGSGVIMSRPTRDGALDKLYTPQKLSKLYYQAVKTELAPINDDGLPLKVLNGKLVKMPNASGVNQRQ